MEKLDIGGFSLIELLVTIAVIAILATISVPIISGTLPTAKSAIAEENLAKLNAAVSTYYTAVGNFTNSTPAGVLASLQARDPLVPGTPFFNANAQVVVTGNTNTYRGLWDAGLVIFKFAKPGTEGSGVDLEALAN